MRAFFFPRIRTKAFSLLELLVASAVLMLMGIVLAGVSWQVIQVWSQGERLTQHRLRARAALEYIGREVRQAMPPVDSSQTNSLQFLINPPGVTQNNPGSIFFQAPVGRDGTQSDVAIIGYFVRWSEGRGSLCRYYVTSGQESYRIRESSNDWINDALLDLEAPGDRDSGYKGVFLENVVGFWVVAFDGEGVPFAGAFDSRGNANMPPSTVEFSMAFLDEKTALRVSAGPELASGIRAAVSASENAESFLQRHEISKVRSGLSVVTFRVKPMNLP